MITLDGTAIRILGVSADEVGNDLATVGIDATVRLVAATLDETMVLLEQ